MHLCVSLLLNTLVYFHRKTLPKNFEFSRKKGHEIRSSKKYPILGTKRPTIWLLLLLRLYIFDLLFKCIGDIMCLNICLFLRAIVTWLLKLIAKICLGRDTR